MAKSPPAGRHVAGARLRRRRRAESLPAASTPPPRPEVVAAVRDLLARLGRADRPRVEQQRRPFEHVAGELPLPAAVEHVAVLVADVAAGEVHRLGVAGDDAAEFRVAHPGQVGERGERRLIARREDVDAGELRGVAQPDRRPRRASRRRPTGSAPACSPGSSRCRDRAEHVARPATGPSTTRMRMRLAGPLQPQVVVAGREAAQLDAGRSATASASNLSARMSLPRTSNSANSSRLGLSGRAEVRQRDRLAGLRVHDAAGRCARSVGSVQVCAVPSGPVAVTRHDVRQRPELHPAARRRSSAWPAPAP